MSNGSDEAKAKAAHASVWAGFGASLRADAEAKRRAAEVAAAEAAAAEAAAAEAEAKAQSEPAEPATTEPELPHIGTEEDERDGVVVIVPTVEQLDAMGEEDVWSYLCTLEALFEAIGHAVAASKHAGPLAMRVHQEIGRRVSDLVGPVAKPEKRKRKPAN